MTTNDNAVVPKTPNVANLNKRLTDVEKRLRYGQHITVRVLDEPERHLRCIFLGMSPDHPNYIVAYNANFGPKEFLREKVVSW